MKKTRQKRKSSGRTQQIIRSMKIDIKRGQVVHRKNMSRQQMILDSLNEVLRKIDEPTSGTETLEKLTRKLGVKSWAEYFSETEKIE